MTWKQSDILRHWTYFVVKITEQQRKTILHLIDNRVICMVNWEGYSTIVSKTLNLFLCWTVERQKEKQKQKTKQFKNSTDN